MAIYSTDADDYYPLSYGMDGDGDYDVARYNGFPAGWDSVVYEQGDSTVWGNSIQPYMKNGDLFEAPGIQKVLMTLVFGSGAYANPRKAPKATSLVFNGLLNGFSQTAVTQPSSLVVLWHGFGKENLVGGINMQPALNCGKVKSCMFNGGGAPSNPTYDGGTALGDIFWLAYTDANDSVWFYGRGQNMARADSSAKFYPLGGSPNTALNNRQDPYRLYGRQGEYWLGTNRCAATSGGTRYSSFFRPDAEFRHQTGNSATTLCFP